RHIEPSWERRETRVCLDLQLMACDQHSVEAQSGYPRQHRGTRAVLQRKAHAVRLGSQAPQVREAFRKVARNLRSRLHRRLGRCDEKSEVGAVDLASA